MSLPASSSTLSNDLFLKNMTILWQLDPRLAMQLDAIDEQELPQPELARSGDWTLQALADDRRSIFLHSRYDPIREADQWAEQNVDDESFFYVVEGFGLGYHLKSGYQKLVGDIIFVIIEPNLHILRVALSCQDFSKELSSRRVIFLSDLNKNDLHRKLMSFCSWIMLGTKIVVHSPSVQAHPRLFAEMRALVMEFMEYARISVTTTLVNSQITCQHVAYNLPVYMSTPPIDMLKSRFTGYPAIIVSAGPSLRKNIDWLAEAQGKAIIVATQTTFKPLLNKNIAPDYVCSLDYHEMSKQYYEGVTDFRQAHLVAEPKAHHSIIDAYRGPVSLLYNDFAQLLLNQAHEPRDSLKPGTSVAHLAFYLAEYLGCNPIIFIGQDLALTDHMYYAPGMAMHEAWQSELNRFSTLEMKEWDRIIRSRPILKKIRDYHGREIYTEDLMYNYLEQFEKDFCVSPARIIDATEGGALKRGAEIMTLRQAMEQFCTRPIDPALLAYRQTQPWYETSKLQTGKGAITRRLEEMRQIRSICQKMFVILNDLKNMTKNLEEFNKKIKQVDELRLRMKEYEDTYQIICSGSQQADIRRFFADQKLKASTTTGIERAKKQLERDIEFVQAMEEGTVEMISVMEETIRRFDSKTRQLQALP